MRVYKCDRCGKFISRGMRDFFIRKPSRGVYRLGKKMHLCGDCEKSFCRWLTEKKEAEE